jgi:hypothetical protein
MEWSNQRTRNTVTFTPVGIVVGLRPRTEQVPPGGHPVRFEFESADKRTSIEIAGIADVAITAAAGQGDAEIDVTNHPLAISPGFPAVVARSEHFRYEDHGMKWEVAEENGFYSPFEYAS